MTIKCLAIDDEPLALKQIGTYIKKTPFLELVALRNSGFDALEYTSSQVDLIFVDINMPDLSGMDFVKSLKEKPYIIFTTAYSEYAIEGFKVDAVDYLLKPIGYNDFLKAVNKVKTLIELKSFQSDISENAGPDHIFVKSEYKLVRIELPEIKYIESMHEYIRIHLSNSKPVMTLASMKSIEEQLPADRFMRVHRSFIVNLDKVKIIERNRIVFENSVYIPIGDQYKDAFQQFVEKHFLM